MSESLAHETAKSREDAEPEGREVGGTLSRPAPVRRRRL